MAITIEQHNRILARLNHLEETMNDLITVLNKTTTASTISAVTTVFETELEDIRSRLTSLETDVQELNEDSYHEED